MILPTTRLRAALRSLLLRAGYRVDSLRYVPRTLRDSASVLPLTFDDAVCRRMVDVGRPLTVVQIGVHDGVTHDPLYRYFCDHGWTGVLVEPQPADCRVLRTLHASRPGIQVIEAAVGATAGVSTLYTVKGEGLPAWTGGLASFSRETILKHRDLLPGLENHIVPVEVPVIPFEVLLSELPEGAPDVLQIDTEGGDADILHLFPFERVRPAIVHWEVKHLTLTQTDACLDLLDSYGYRFAPSGGEDMLAVRSV